MLDVEGGRGRGKDNSTNLLVPQGKLEAGSLSSKSLCLPKNKDPLDMGKMQACSHSTLSRSSGIERNPSSLPKRRIRVTVFHHSGYSKGWWGGPHLQISNLAGRRAESASPR